MSLTYGHDSSSAVDSSVVVVTLQGLAAGTLVYVAFFEILERERSKSSNRLLQWTLIILGFLAILGLEALSTYQIVDRHFVLLVIYFFIQIYVIS